MKVYGLKKKEKERFFLEKANFVVQKGIEKLF